MPSNKMMSPPHHGLDHRRSRRSTGSVSGSAEIFLTSSSSPPVVTLAPRVRSASSRSTAALAGWPIFALRLVHQNFRVEPASALLSRDAQLVFAALARGEAAFVNSPPARDRRKFEAFGLPGRGDDFRRDRLALRRAVQVEQGRLKKNALADARVFRAEGQADALALGHVPLVRHPAHHLAPETVVVSCPRRRAASAMRCPCP